MTTQYKLLLLCSVIVLTSSCSPIQPLTIPSLEPTPFDGTEPLRTTFPQGTNIITQPSTQVIPTETSTLPIRMTATNILVACPPWAIDENGLPDWSHKRGIDISSSSNPEDYIGLQYIERPGGLTLISGGLFEDPMVSPAPALYYILLYNACQQNDQHNNYIVAIAGNQKSGFFDHVKWAWLANRKTGQLDPLPTDGITCKVYGES